MSQWNRRSVAVLGVPFDNVTMCEAIDLIEKKIEEPGFHQVATANVDFVINAIYDQGMQEMLCSCDLIVPDGMPIVWASRLMGSRLKERVSGVDLIPRLAELAARRDYGIFLLGASETNSRKASEVLKQRFPKLRIVGRYSPPVSPLAEMDHEKILSLIERARPDILLVAMGHPKQEQWLAMHRHRLRVSLCMGVGASLDFLAGAVSRAPVWMQTAGLEWLYRAAQEPRRLSQRYLSDAYGLARHLPAQVAANAIQPRGTTRPAVQTDRQGSISVISVHGDLSGGLLAEFERELGRAYQEDGHIVLNLAPTGYLGLDSVGFLVQLSRLMQRGDRQLYLAGMTPHISRVFRAARMHRFFVSCSTVNDALYRVRKAEDRLSPERIVLRPIASPPVDLQVQMEILKDLCRRIVSLSQTASPSANRPGTRTVAAR